MAGAVSNRDFTAPGGMVQTWHEIRRGTRQQGNVILALMFKDFRSRASAGRLGLLWIILDPVSKIILLSLFWWLGGRTEISGVHVALYIAVAVIPFTVVSRAISGISIAITSNQAYYNYPQVKPIDALIARYTLDTTVLMIGAILIFFFLSWYFNLNLILQNILPIISLMLLCIILGFGLALFNGTYGCIYDGYSKIVSVLSRPLIFVSAIFFSPNDLPADARYYISWNPITQLIEYLRYYSLGTRLFPEASITYTSMFALVALFMGFVAYYPNRLRLLER